MLVRGAVVAAGKRRALARFALAGGRLAAAHAAVEQPGLELRLDERDRRRDSLPDRPGDLRLCRDREVAADVVEERPVRSREVMRVMRETRHRLLALAEHSAPVLEARRLIDVGVDQILDRAVDRPRVLIHAGLQLREVGLHTDPVSRPSFAFASGLQWSPRLSGSESTRTGAVLQTPSRSLSAEETGRYDATCATRAPLTAARARRSTLVASASVSYFPVNAIQ